MVRRIVFTALVLVMQQAAAATAGKSGCKDSKGVTHSVGSKWQPDACTFCECPKSGQDPICAAQSCALLKCPDGLVPELPNEKICCPTKCVDLSTSLVAENCQTVCSTKWGPVCGNDGSTYINMCHFQLAQCVRNDKDFKVMHDGVCTDEEEAAAKDKTDDATSKTVTTSKPRPTAMGTKKPVKVTERANMGALTNAVPSTTEVATSTTDGSCTAVTCPAREKCQPGYRLSANENEPCCKTCVADDKCPRVCLKSFDPVCGTDGQTYASQCDMMSIACEQGLNVEASSKGSCEKDGPRPVQPPQTPGDCNLVVCSLDYRPVCGSDGITYDNLCKLGMASCMSEKAGGNSLYLASSGPCSESASSITSEPRGTTVTEASTPTETPVSATGGSLSGEKQPPVIVQPDTSSGDSSTRAVAIGVSVALGVLILVMVMVGAGIMYSRARRNRKARKAAGGAKPSMAPSELPIIGNASAISTVHSGPMVNQEKKYIP